MYFLYILLSFICILALCAIIYSLVHFLVTGNTPSISASKEIIKELSGKLNLYDDELFYDLGCGNGNLIFGLSKNFPQTNFIGVENSITQYLFAKFKLFLSKTKRKKVSIKFENFFKTDLSKADHVYIWIYTRDISILKEKFEKELKKGCYVYSLDFPIPEVPVYETIELNKTRRFGHTLFTYKY